MNLISFQNPAALLFLPLAALPAVIHLFRHNRAKVIPFPSVILLRSTLTRTWRRSRLQEWLLLITRTIILLLLVLLMAGPSANIVLPAWLAPHRMSLGLVIDDSASMSVIEGDSSLLSRARTEAIKLVSGLDPASRVVVIGGSQGNEIICGLSTPAEAVKSLLSVDQTALGTDLSGGVLKADVLLSNAGANSAEIFVFSDLCRNCFGGRKDPLPALRSKAAITMFKTERKDPGKNLEWRNVKYYPLKKRLIIQGKTAQQVQISLIRDGQVVYQTNIVPDSTGDFSAGLGWDGAGRCFLECSDDDMPLDDRFYLPSGIGGSIRVLLIAEEEGVLFRAFSALASADYRFRFASHPDTRDIAASDLVVVAGRNLYDLTSALAEAVKNGTGLLIMPPEKANMADYNRLLAGLTPDLRIEGMAAKEPLPAAAWSIEFGPESYFQDISSRDLRHISVYKYWQIKPAKPALLTVGLTAPGLLTVDRGKGKAAIWLFGVESGMTDIGFHPAFLAVLNQLCHGLTRSGNGGYTTGQLLSSPGLSGLKSPQGVKVTGLSGSNGIEWPLKETGFYTADKNGLAVSLAVNIPPDESDLSFLSEDQLKNIMKNATWKRQNSLGLRLVGRSDLRNLLLLLTGLFLMLELVLRSKLKIFLKNPLTT